MDEKLYDPYTASSEFIDESFDLLSNLYESGSQDEVVIGLSQKVKDFEV